MYREGQPQGRPEARAAEPDEGREPERIERAGNGRAAPSEPDLERDLLSADGNGAVEPELADRFGLNAGVVEEIRRRYEVDPRSVDPSWSDVFGERARPARPVPVSEPARTRAPAAPEAAVPQPRADLFALGPKVAEKHARVLRLIHAFRSRGHRVAQTNPLHVGRREFPEVDPAHYGLGPEDEEQPFIAGDLPGGPVQPLRQILERLRATYCGHIGVEFTHLQDPGPRLWLQQRMETTCNTPDFDRARRVRILLKLASADVFERFLHTKFLGQKRFSLEGAEAVIPLLDEIVESMPGHGVREMVLGMAHRGRLNVMANVLGASYETLFSEFEDVPIPESPMGSGDVKYHKGFASDRDTISGERVHLTLTANPSHLEAVDPVVEGRTRAKQVRNGDLDGRSTLPVLLHGDAAFAGQGIVAETLNLSKLEGFSTGGTVHVVVNNQIGFTTAPGAARSTLYATDIAKMIQAPILHVNGDDPDAVVYAALLALDYRQRFHGDVVIDLLCYRRHGHNEGDEPSFTNPVLYEEIRSHRPVRRIYTEKLMQEGLLEQSEAEQMESELRETLARALQTIKTRPPEPLEPAELHGPWRGFSRTPPESDPETGVPVERLAQLAEALASVPADFNVHRKLAPLLERRRKVIPEGGPVDFALAEALAFGSLLVEGRSVRMSGQDSARGTFSQRHAVLVDQKTGGEHVPLAHLSRTQGRFEVYDSLLSEAAVLGFEYGYSLADPHTLTLWEAQFGDFVNGAQVIIDQFIAAAHMKWNRMSGLVMLLPHGYEGQGPEHSSARPERFLQLCAQHNLQVVNCTTAAQYFHVLRRQMHRSYRAPLVILTPKSLLRSARAASAPDELASGGFRRVLDDPRASQSPGDVHRVLLCSGKVYYDLLEERERRFGEETGGVAIVRVEQLFPWPGPELSHAVRAYDRAERVYWVQEEPANMGAWTFVLRRLPDLLLPRHKLAYAGRGESASPAVGSSRIHREEQEELVRSAFADLR